MRYACSDCQRTSVFSDMRWDATFLLVNLTFQVHNSLRFRVPQANNCVSGLNEWSHSDTRWSVSAQAESYLNRGGESFLVLPQVYFFFLLFLLAYCLTKLVWAHLTSSLAIYSTEWLENAIRQPLLPERTPLWWSLHDAQKHSKVQTLCPLNLFFFFQNQKYFQLKTYTWPQSAAPKLLHSL